MISVERKKSYINIYYVDKSIDKSSLARARSPRFSLSLFFTSSHPQPARASPNLPPTGHLLPPGPPGRWGWEQLGYITGTEDRYLGSILRPRAPPNAGGGCFGPGRLHPSWRAAAGSASGWREEGGSLRPARRGGRKALGAESVEPARGHWLAFPPRLLYRFKLGNFFLNSPSKK